MLSPCLRRTQPRGPVEASTVAATTLLATRARNARSSSTRLHRQHRRHVAEGHNRTWFASGRPPTPCQPPAHRLPVLGPFIPHDVQTNTATSAPRWCSNVDPTPRPATHLTPIPLTPHAGATIALAAATQYVFQSHTPLAAQADKHTTTCERHLRSALAAAAGVRPRCATSSNPSYSTPVFVSNFFWSTCK
jgi:hypothetical protein